MTRTLDRIRELALVPGANAGAFARHDLSEGGKIALQSVRILVVDRVNVLLAEPAWAITDGLFWGGGHNGGSRVPAP